MRRRRNKTRRRTSPRRSRRTRVRNVKSLVRPTRIARNRIAGDRL